MEFEDFENYSYIYDLSEEDESPQSSLSIAHMISLSFYSVAFLLGVPGNAIVIWFMGFKWDKSVSTLWFLNLAIADFIFVLFLPLYITYVAMGFHWPFGKWLCKMNSFIALLNMFASVFFLTFISLDRYIRLVHPVFSYKYRTVRNTLILSGIIWISAAIIGGPALYFRDTTTILNNITLCYNNFHVCSCLRSRHQMCIFACMALCKQLAELRVLLSLEGFYRTHHLGVVWLQRA
uniref:G protein-coupled receptor 1 n=1 Tax=Nothoprocta perdicaria TaxID=30464 RepID=A0A8C6ZBK0_NOTPE